jgi:hypothetical protein
MSNWVNGEEYFRPGTECDGEQQPRRGKILITPGFNPGKAESEFPPRRLKYRR